MNKTTQVRVARIVLLNGVLLGLTACSHRDYSNGNSPPATYTLGGTVSGLNGTLVLQNSGGTDLTVTSNGAYVFSGAFANGSAFGVTVKTNPANPAQSCAVSNGAGTINGSNIGNIAIACTTNAYIVGGTIGGLTGTVILQINAGNDITLTTNGSFTFTAPIASGNAYSVTVKTQPTLPAQTCAVANGSGSIANGNIANVMVTCSVNLYSIGYSVTGLTGSGLVLQNNATDNAAVVSNGSYVFATSIASGQNYNVSVLQQPSNPVQSCSIANGSGTVNHDNILAPIVACVMPGAQANNFVYVTNANDDTVSAYAVNPTSGTLTAVPGSPFAVGDFPISVTVDVSSRFVYVLSRDLGNVSVYAINHATGALTAITGSPFGAGVDPRDMALDPLGRFAYVVNPQSRSVGAYTIHSTTGALTPVAGSPHATGNFPLSVVVSPRGKFVYVSNLDTHDISTYTVDQVTGVLTAANIWPPAMSPYSVTVDPKETFAYVANATSDSVSAFAIHSTSGVLTALPASFSAGERPGSIAIDPSGKFAYVTNELSNNVSAYTIHPTTGVLTEMTGSPFAAGLRPMSVSVALSGKFVYLVNYNDNNVSGYSMNATTGMLTEVPGSPFAAGTSPISLAIASFEN